MSVIIQILLCLCCAAIGWLARWIYARFKLTSIEQKAVRLNQEAIKEAEAKSRELVLETRDQLLKEQQQQERDARERRSELQRSERRLQLKEENLERKQSEIDAVKHQQQDREAKLANREKSLQEKELECEERIAQIASLSREDAKRLIMEAMKDEAEHDAQVILNKVEQETQIKADKLARDIVVTTIQRVATEVCSDVTVSSVSLPSDEMKGRIIGREGRNIRALETLTGVDIIIDDTQEAVV
ncbi:MAG: Rnase Y domain-containing protein, partial [Sphaerochaetaceae bacterium]